MLIISQDNEYIVNMDNVVSIYKEDKDNTFLICCMSNPYENHIPVSGKIGEYSTEEKRNSVMRQILDAYGNDWKVFEMPEE